MVKPLAQICTFRLLKTLQKLSRRVWYKKNVEILLQHDSTWPHASLETQEAVTKLRQTVPVHPPYSPDLASSDFHLFGALKDAIYGRNFGSYGHRFLKKWASGHMYNMKLIVIDDQKRCKFCYVYLFPISSTCFGRCFCRSSGALDCNYSFWYSPLILLPPDIMDEHPWHQLAAK